LSPVGVADEDPVLGLVGNARIEEGGTRGHIRSSIAAHADLAAAIAAVPPNLVAVIWELVTQKVAYRKVLDVDPCLQNFDPVESAGYDILVRELGDEHIIFFEGTVFPDPARTRQSHGRLH